MIEKESVRFKDALSNQGFNEHDIKVVLAILEGNEHYNQEDIIMLSEHNTHLLKKLGWLRKVKAAMKDSNLHLTKTNG